MHPAPFVAGEYLVKDLTERVGNLRNHRLEDGTLCMWQNFYVFGGVWEEI